LDVECTVAERSPRRGRSNYVEFILELNEDP
jgi:hypothetical protein